MHSVHDLLGTRELFEDLDASPRTAAWSQILQAKLQSAFEPEKNGNLSRWLGALDKLPQLAVDEADWGKKAVSCSGSASPEEIQTLKDALLQLSPWRKGPFSLFDLLLDSEWRSDLKWERLSPHLDLSGKDVLDVGCGNGYYAFRMREAGARRVVGLDPYLLYLVQFAALRRYLGSERIHLVAAGDQDIPANLRLFEMVFSMGVLYHRKSPIEHIQSLYHSLKQGGELVLETLVIPGQGNELLIPRERYAQMKNVWFFPTCALLQQMVEKCGFTDVKLLDLTRTTMEEQRQTEWMQFDSLSSFLDPKQPELTIEGYPGPLRAALWAKRP